MISRYDGGREAREGSSVNILYPRIEESYIMEGVKFVSKRDDIIHTIPILLS